MSQRTPEAVLAEMSAVPEERDVRTLDVRALGPPEPLARTLETLVDVPSDAVLLQYNDRAPRFLYPKLDDRGFAFETEEEVDDVVCTAIWEP